ncbi:MAG: prepilin-type N-terminal cleavage/methylation domain-containing protein [Patescibacteria group bacterium]|nr:prepilin-type N-terminal cleavage/methylation domain-containing protein [Patescibacteria group bacterium]
MIKKNKKNAFTLIEIMISLSVIFLLMFGIYDLINYSLNITSDNKSYVEAISIANQKMEQIRNMPYSNVGTIGGMPNGIIPENEIINKDKEFTVHTMIQFYDDPYDGTLEQENDSIFVDYKIVTIDVSWKNKTNIKKISVFSKVIPSTEENLTGYGLLKIIVTNSNGSPIQNANVNISNSNLVPNIDATYTTNVDGIISIPTLPDFENYQIIVNKELYSEERTYSRSAENPNPTRINLSVQESKKTEEGFSIDLLGSLTIKTLNETLLNDWQVNTDETQNIQKNSAIKNSGEFSYIVWEDYRSASSSIYMQKYNNLGEKQWISGDKKISNDEDQKSPSITEDIDGNFYITWNKLSNDEDAYLTKIDNNGNILWGPKVIQTSIQTSNQISTKIKSLNHSTSTVVSWVDDINSGYDIYIQKYSIDGNKEWINNIRVNTNPINDSTNQYNQNISIDSNDDIYIVWTDDRNGNLDIYAQKFDTNGNALWANDKKINNDVGVASQYSPNINIDSNDDIYIVWTDDRNGNLDIYAQKFDTNGNALWDPNDLRVNINLEQSPQTNATLDIDDENNIHIVWTDDRNGNLDIYMNSFEEYGKTNTISNIPIRISGTKKIGDDPIILKYQKEFYTDSNGLITLDNLEWDDPGYTIEIITASTTYRLIMTEPYNQIKILPEDDKTILLYLED